MFNQPLIVEYYSDVLCVWAWIAQRRVDELQSAFGTRIELQLHYINIFGDCAGKMAQQWSDRGGYSGFSKHVIESAEPYDSATVNPDVWEKVRPTTSANAHLVLKAVEQIAGKDVSATLALALRKAFFVEARDISRLDFLYELVSGFGVASTDIHAVIEDGSAMAALMADYQQAQHWGLKGSPSYLMDGGRQTLFGNVGYRVLHANIEELLRKPATEASWC